MVSAPTKQSRGEVLSYIDGIKLMRNSERLDLNYAKVQWASLSLYRCMQEEFSYVSELVPLSTVQVLRLEITEFKGNGFA